MAYPIAAVIAGSGGDPCCCSLVPTCCEYPALGIVDSSYPYTDLPATLYDPSAALGPYTRVTPYLFSGIMIYYDAPDEAGEKQYIGIEDGADEWTSGSFFVTGGACLINNILLLTDGFNDTYTVTFTIDDPLYGTPIMVDVDRTLTACLWSGTWGDGDVYMYYSAISYKWEVRVISSLIPGYIGPAQKVDPQDDVTGSYTDGGGLINVSVA